MAHTIKPIYAGRASRLNKQNRDVANGPERKHRCDGLGRRSMSVKAALMDAINSSDQDEADDATLSNVEHEVRTKH